MDLTQGTEKEKKIRSRKMMLWFAIGSMTMMFAGLTSAYVVSKSRPDWVNDLHVPHVFIWSTLVIVLSSVALGFVKKAITQKKRGLATGLLSTAFGLGILFAILQFKGFNEFVANGYYPAGSASTINVSFYYIIIFTHLLHLLAGLIVLTVVIYNHFKQRYKTGQTLGLELGALFWHFVDFIWLYLFFFIYFIG